MVTHKSGDSNVLRCEHLERFKHEYVVIASLYADTTRRVLNGGETALLCTRLYCDVWLPRYNLLNVIFLFCVQFSDVLVQITEPRALL